MHSSITRKPLNLVLDSDDDECEFSTTTDALHVTTPPSKKRCRHNDCESSASVFSPRAAACAEALLQQQADAKTPHDRLSLLRRVGNLNGPYRECLKGSPSFSMWLRYVEFNRDIIADTERFLAAQGRPLDTAQETGSESPPLLAATRRTTSAFRLAGHDSGIVGSCQPLPRGRLSRSVSSARSSTPAAITGVEEPSAEANSRDTYELSQAERCALSLFAMQSDRGPADAVIDSGAPGAKRFRGAGDASEMAPSRIYEGSGFLTAAQSIDRLVKPHRMAVPSPIEEAAADLVHALPSLSGTIIETQIAKSQREWLEWSRAATLCPY